MAEGRLEEAGRLTAWVLDNVAPDYYFNYPAYQLVKAEALAIGGRDDDALKAIEEIVETQVILGWQWRLRDNPHFDNIRDRPEFAAILKKISDRNARIRGELKRQASD